MQGSALCTPTAAVPWGMGSTSNRRGYALGHAATGPRGQSVVPGAAVVPVSIHPAPRETEGRGVVWRGVAINRRWSSPSSITLGSLNSTSCITPHTSSVQFGEAPSGAYKNCPAVPEIVTDAPTAPVTGQASAAVARPCALSLRVSLTSVLKPPLSLSTPPLLSVL